MRSTALKLICTGALLCAAPVASNAQIDPSSAILLNGGRVSPVRDSGLDSGRYTVRPRPEGMRREDPLKTNKRSSVAESPAKVEPQSTPSPSSPETTNVSVPTSSSPLSSGSSGQATVPTRTEDSNVRGPVEPSEERKLSQLEISVAPGFIYANSDSSFSYRKHNAASPSIGMEASVWITPGFGLSGSYISTLSGHVNDSWNGSRSVSASQQWFTGGIRSRHFFGASRLAPVLEFGVDYMEYQFRVPSDAQTRAKLNSTGLQLSLESDIPVTAHRSWIVGIQFAPKLQHKEGATAIEFRSGGSVDSNAVGLTLGGRVHFDHANAMFWKVTHIVEKNLFAGDATRPDPISGATLNGVAVTNSTTLLQVGYTWGN